MLKRVVLSGGGTGGHIYPALAIASAIKEGYPEVELGYIGRGQGMEADIVARMPEIDFHAIEVQGFSRKNLFNNWQTLTKLWRAIRDSRQYLKAFEPDIVIGTGGYVSGPALYAAHKLGIPTLIHEQNVLPGLTTKILARYVNSIAVSFESTVHCFDKSVRVFFTGNPRASEVAKATSLEGRKLLGIESVMSPVVLLMTGSLGAEHVNTVFIDFLRKAQLMSHVQFLYVTGQRHYDAVCEQLAEAELSNVKIFPFIYDMPKVLATSNVVVARAGATILSEVTALGIPSILIPSPYVTDNHQEKNARLLESSGAAAVVLEAELTPEILYDKINKILNDRELASTMQKAAKLLGRPDAVDVIINELECLV